MSIAWLQGKTVLVTGAASGLGAATAVELHRLGARLALLDRDADGVQRVAAGIGADAIAFTADVTDAGALRAAVRDTVARFGQLDVVWANAGIACFGPLAAIDEAAWLRTIDVNLIGTFHTLRAALPEVTRRRGHVAVTASLAAFVNGPCLSAYCATKSGVEALCNSLRVELAHHQVTVGCIHPSWVATPMVANADELAGFRRLRAALPSPLRRDMPVEEAARRIARGIAERRARVYLPRFVRFLRWLRTPLHTTLGERDSRRAMPEIEAAWHQDVAHHGVAEASGRRATPTMPSSVELPTA